MSKLKAVVVGLGKGLSHIRGYQSHPGVVVAGIADFDEELVESAATKYSIDGKFSSAEEMIAATRPDIVSIVVPNKYHKSLAIHALNSGAHVLCEKPMAMNSSEAEEMIAVAKSADRRLMINFSFRFTAESQALKREVESGVLGEIYFGRTVWHRRRGVPRFGGWFTQKDVAGGGPLIDLGVHRLDLALWLMGYPKPVWVMGATYNPIAKRLADEAGLDYTVEDLAAGFIRFENGATLVVEASWAANIREKELMETRLLGTDAGLVQRNVREGYEFEAELHMERNGSVYDIRLSNSANARSPMEHFADSILDGTPHVATGEEGLVVMNLLDALYASADRNEPIKIE